MERGRRRSGGRAGVAVLAGALAALFTLAGCSSSGGDESTGTTTAKTSSTTSSSTSTTSTTSSTTAPTTGTTGTTDGAPVTTTGLGSLPAGTHYGYLTGITAGVVEGQAVSIVSFDKVDFLTGAEAVAAAREAGAIGPDEDSVPNDYFIRNVNPLIRKLPVIPDSQVFVLDGGTPDLVPSGIDTAVATPGLYKLEIVVVRGVSLITSTEGVFLP